MDSKLKALKVADLKAILTKAGVSAPAKATKADLIAKITSSQPAIDAYNSTYGPSDANGAAVTTEPEQPVDEVPIEAQAEAPPAEIAPEPSLDAPEPVAPVATEDTEEEKRRKRAARFGIPVVESKPAAATKGRNKISAAPVTEDGDKLKARAQRFGVPQGSKRAAEAEVDPEEAEKRRKRAERFGMGASDKS